MALNNKVLLAKHPRFDSVPNDLLHVLANSLVEIYLPEQDNADWDPVLGTIKTPRHPVFRGWAVITPNKDWRARDRSTAGDDTAVHAYRVQLLNYRKNLLKQKAEWGDPSTWYRGSYGHEVQIIEHNTDPARVGMWLYVRNAVTDSDMWQATLLCDVDTGR